MTDTVVAEGQVKFRDGKKWKTRWVVLRKPSPVADCLFLLAFKKEKKKAKKGTGQKERLSLTLEGICGVEPASGFDGVSYSLSILCISHTLVLGFHSREAVEAWDSRIRFHLGEVHRFSVNVEPGTKLESGPASLHLCNNQLVVTKGLPPVVSGHWKLSALRRYGAVPNGFVFEGGTRCGYWAGVFFLSCSEGEQISFLFDCIVRGISPSRTPQGLPPALPDSNPASTEERIIQETSELEKRLSRLSNCSLASSTASTFSCSTSVAGDDHSSLSSSSSSQSEASYGGRLPFWVDSLSKLHPSIDTVSTCPTLKALTSSDDRLYAAVTGSAGTRPSLAQLHPRGLHDSGRQSSLDSGIGIVTGSQSSGSFSSYTGSLDAAIHAGGEELGSVGSLSSPQTSAPPITPPPPPPTVAHPTPISERAPSTCTSSSSSSCSSRCSSRASRMRSDEYSVPSLLRLRYDTPRSVLQTLRDPSSPGAPSDLSRDSSKTVGQGQCASSGSPEGKGLLQATMQRSNSWDSEGGSTARPQSLPSSSVCRQTQYGHGSDNYINPEQWRSVGNKSLTQVEKSASEQSPPAFGPGQHDDNRAFGNLLARLKISMTSIPAAPLALPVQPKTACGVFRSDSEAAHSAFLDTGRHSHNTVHYVNIPVSPLLTQGNRELLYSELDLREPSPAPVCSRHAALRGNV